jgi:hypothetical protein
VGTKKAGDCSCSRPRSRSFIPSMAALRVGHMERERSANAFAHAPLVCVLVRWGSLIDRPIGIVFYRRGMITCFVEYTIDAEKTAEFERFARAWIGLVDRHGGTHHGYFLPS